MQSSYDKSSPSTSNNNNYQDQQSSNPSINIDLYGMQSKCTGQYSVSNVGMTGSVVVLVSTSDDMGTSPSLHLSTDITSRPLLEEKSSDNTTNSKGQLSFPALATISSCTPNFYVQNVQFSGSASSQVIGLFSRQISKMITNAMNTHVCTLVKRHGESWLDRLFYGGRLYVGGLILNKTSTLSGQKSDQHVVNEGIIAPLGFLGRYIATATTTTTSSDENVHVVNWDNDMPLLKRILLGLNSFISKHLNEGMIIQAMQKFSTWSDGSCDDCGFFFKGINGIINSLTVGSGAVEFTLPPKLLNFHHNHTFTIPSYGEVILTAHTVKVSGVNDLTDLALLRPDGMNMLSSSIASNTGFNVSILIDLEIKPAANGRSFQGDTLNETFELHFNASNVNFTTSSEWELDREIFNKLSVGSFIYGSYSVFDTNRNILNCIIEALTSVTLVDMQGRMDINTMHVTPIVPAYEKGDKANLEDNIDELINNVLKLILTEYAATTTDAVAGLIQSPIKSMINDGLQNLIGDTKKMPLHCVNVDVPKNKSEQPLRLDNTKVLTLFNEVVNGGSAIDIVNTFIGCVTNVMGTKQLLQGHFFNFSLGEYKLVLHDLHLENMNSLHEMEVLSPEIDHYHLVNSLEYGGSSCAATSTTTTTTDTISGCDDDTTTSTISFGMNLGNAKQYLGNIQFHIEMSNLKLHGGTELHFDMNYLPFLQITDLVKHPQCLTIPITNFDFYGFNATVDKLAVTIEADLVASADNPLSKPQTFTYKMDDSSELAVVVSTLASKGATLLQEVLGDEFMTQLNTAENICDTPVNPRRSIETKRSTASAGLWTFLIILVFIAGNAWLFLRGFKNDEPEDGESQVEDRQQLNEPLLNNEDDDEMNENLEVETPRYKFPLASSTSLMYHPSIHPALKYGFPVVIASAFILFFSGNLSVGASVDLLVTRANGSNVSSLVNIYTFSLGSTLKEMVNAGVYLLMLLILFCSGVWPYVKLVLLALCWILSTRKLSPIRREKILYLLDCLGKFSLIDCYVLVLMMVAFRYGLEVEGVGALNVYVTPKYGFYSFLFATIVSLVSGHVMLNLHRRTMMPSIPVYSGRYEALAKHIFDDKHGKGLVKLTKRFRRSIVFLLFLAFILISVGIGLKSFHFKFNGVAGSALGADRVRSYSLVSIGTHIPLSVQNTNSFGVSLIQTCYFFFALIMPMVCLLSMIVLFLVPMKLRQQKKVFVIAEVANAWSAIEVFVIAIM